MEDVLSTVLRGCVMARELEVNMIDVVQHPRFLRDTCQQIAATFASAVERLSGITGVHLGSEEHAPPVGLVGTTVPEGRMVAGADHQSTMFNVVEEQERVVLDSRSTTGSLVQRSSRKSRKAKESMLTVKVPVSRMGNVDLPPDDGHTWRKYGQKLIFGAGFPRSYYRCTHKSFYGCEAKKQVQRLDHDPFTFEVTYFGNHTCQTTTTPLAIPTITLPANVEDQGSQVLHHILPPPPPRPSSSLSPYLPTTAGMSSLQFQGSSIADVVGRMFEHGGGGGNVNADFFSST